MVELQYKKSLPYVFEGTHALYSTIELALTNQLKQ